MAVRDVEEQHAARRELGQVEADRVERDEVHRRGVRAVGVEDDQIIDPVGGPGQGEPGVAQDDEGLGRAVPQEREEARVPGDPEHDGVDLVERPPLVRLPVAGERPRAEPDDGHRPPRGRAIDRGEELAEGPARVEVRQGLPPARRREPLHPVERGPVHEHVVLAARVARHPRDAEEAPLRVEQAPFLALIDGAGEEERGEAQREPDGAPPEGEAEERHQPHGGADRLGPIARALEADEQPDRQDAEAERQEEVQDPARAAEPRGGGPRGQEREQRQDEGVLEHVREHDRGEQRRERASHHAADREPEVELGEVARVGLVAGQLAVADHRRHEEDHEVRRDHEGQRLVGPGDQDEHQRQERHRQELDPDAVRDDPPPAEHEGEREEVDRQRHDPEERDRRDVGGQIGRDAQHQARRDGGEEHPARAPGPRDGPVRAVRRRGARRGRGERARGLPRMTGRAGTPEREGAGGGQHDQAPVAPCPEVTLRVQAEQALDDDRVGEEREHAAEVARRVEDVRVSRSRVARRGEPGLEDGARRGDGEEGEPDGHREQGEEPGDRARLAGRRPARRQRDRQDQERQEQDQQVEARLAARPEPAHRRVGVGVSHEQDRLVEHHRRVPHGRRPAEQRQRHPREHGLDQEQEARTDEDRDAEEDQHRAGSWRSTLAAPAHRVKAWRVHTVGRARSGAIPREEERGWAS